MPPRQPPGHWNQETFAVVRPVTCMGHNKPASEVLTLLEMLQTPTALCARLGNEPRWTVLEVYGY